MRVITIMPDFGLGPYAWQRGEGLIADAVTGFRLSEFKVSPELEAEFADWIDWFGGGALNPDFSWQAFHWLGIDLSRKLKAELGDQARVIYCKPLEDPACWTAPDVEIEILDDGTLKPIKRRRWANS